MGFFRFIFWNFFLGKAAAEEANMTEEMQNCWSNVHPQAKLMSTWKSDFLCSDSRGKCIYIGAYSEKGGYMNIWEAAEKTGAINF